MKAKLKKTGEIIELDDMPSITDYIRHLYRDNNGNKYKSEEFEFIDERNNDSIDWQQVRINAAIAAMNGVISNPAFCNTSTNRGLPIKIAVDMADALIEELKKEK